MLALIVSLLLLTPLHRKLRALCACTLCCRFLVSLRHSHLLSNASLAPLRLRLTGLDIQLLEMQQCERPLSLCTSGESIVSLHSCLTAQEQSAVGLSVHQYRSVVAANQLLFDAAIVILIVHLKMSRLAQTNFGPTQISSFWLRQFLWKISFLHCCCCFPFPKPSDPAFRHSFTVGSIRELAAVGLG